jgi:hypothetical protein
LCKLAVIKETTDAEKWNSEKCEISNDDLNLEKKHLSDTKIVEQNNGISTGELHNLTKDTVLPVLQHLLLCFLLFGHQPFLHLQN